MKSTHFIFDSLIIQVTRKAIKHMYVRIKAPDGQVSISIPKRAKLDVIRQQLELKKEWIHSQRARLAALPNPASLNFKPDECVSFLGKNHALVIHPQNRRNPITFNGDVFYFAVGDEASLSDKLRLLNIWYRQQFQALLPPLIKKWETVIPVRVTTFTIRAMKTRWGSCNTRTGRICLNLNLMKQPLSCLEYVLVHEMVHLLEASHNKRFYRLMTEFMPDWHAYHHHLNPNSRKRHNGELVNTMERGIP